MKKTTIFSRLIMVLLALGILGLAYWFISTSMLPVEVPQQLIMRRVVKFDPKLDISTNEKFLTLRPLGEFVLTMPAMGRENPFVPPVVAARATSTGSVTSTQGIQMIPQSDAVTSSETAATILPSGTQTVGSVATTTGQ